MNGYEHDIDRLQNANEKLQNEKVQLLEEIRALNKRCTNLSKGYDRVVKERDEARKELSERSVELLRYKLSTPDIGHDELDALQGETDRLNAIIDSLTESRNYYKSIAGLNDPEQ